MIMIDDFIIAIALAMDALTVSVSGGAALNKPTLKKALLVASYFGFFQFFMPILGWYGGMFFNNVIDSYDHWIAFGLLIIVGGKMIWEFFKNIEEKAFSLNHKLLLVLSIATSIDALGVGLSYAFLNKSIMTPAIIIGVVTFVFSTIGVCLGKSFKKVLGSKAELVGGIILIAIGVNILINHGVFK